MTDLEPSTQEPSLRDQFLERAEALPELDQGPERGRLRERFLRRAEPVKFAEAATTTSFGETKELWDWLPFVATGREGIGWVDMYQSASAFNDGTHTADQRRMLEDFLDWHARERGFWGGVGEIAGDLPVFAGEFGGGFTIAKLLGKKLMQTAAGAGLHKALTKMASTRVAGALEANVLSRTVGKLAAKGAQGVAIGVVSELPRAPWGRIMANARRLQYQRRFGLSTDEAGQLVVDILADPQTLMDVLPQSIVDELIEYGSEMTGAAIPFVAKLDALHDDLIGFLISKKGMKAGREFLAKYGIGGTFQEIGEEYLGAAAREVAGRAGLPELKGAFPATFDQTLEMYVAFGLRGGVGAAQGALGEGVEKVREKAREDRLRRDLGTQYTSMFERAGVEFDEEMVSRRVEADIEALRGAKTVGEEEEGEEEPPITEEELEALEAMEPEEAEEILREKGLVPVSPEEEEAEAETPSSEEAKAAQQAEVVEGEEVAPTEEVTAEEEASEPEIVPIEPGAAEEVSPPEEEEQKEPRSEPDSPPEVGRHETTGALYHGSGKAPEGPFKPFTHFGTRKAAEGRLEQLTAPSPRFGPVIEGEGEVFEVDFRPESPLRVQESPFGFDSTDALISNVQQAGGITPKEGDALRALEDAEAREGLAERLRAKGYDSLVYENAAEDPGEDSFISLAPVEARRREGGAEGGVLSSPPVQAPPAETAGESIGGQMFGSLEGEPEWTEGTPISAPQVVKAFSGILGAEGEERPIKVGRILGPAIGVFKRHPNLIRLRTANDIATAAHEVAHALEYQAFGRANPWTGLPQPLRDDLMKLGKALYGTHKPSGGYMREGWAEYVRIRLTEGTDAAKTAAPALSEWVESRFLREHPGIASALEAGQKAADQWRGQGSVKRASASVVEPKGVVAGTAEAVSSGDLARRAYDLVIDELGPLFRVTKDAEERLGRQLRPSESPALAAKALRRIAPGRLKYMVNLAMLDFAGNHTGPALRDSIQLVRGRKNDFTLYIYARRAMALWDDPRGARNPGLSREDAQQVLEELDSKEMALAAKGVYEWLDGILDYASQASPTYAGVVEKIRARDPGDYAPLKRVFAELDKVARGAGGVARGNLVSRLRGSGRQVKDIFPVILADAERTLLKSHQRFVLERLLDISKAPDMGHIVEKLPPDRVPAASRTVEELIKEVEKRLESVGAGLEVVPEGGRSEEAGEVLQEIVTFFAPAWDPKSSEDPIIPVVEEGQLVYYSVPSALYKTLEGLDTVYLNKAVEVFLGIPARTFRMGTTGLRASFGLITNPLRDVQTLFLNTRSNAREWDIFGAWFTQMFRAGIRLLSGGKRVDEYTDAAMRLGVDMAQPLSLDTNYTRREAKRLFSGRFTQLAHISTWPDLLRDAIQFPEMAPRAAEIKLIAKDLGWEPGTPLSLDQAFELTIAGKESTTDFTAAGSFGKAMNRVVPFFNAQIQGPRVTAVRTSEHLGRNILRGLIGVTMPTLLLWWLYGDEDWYEEMPIEEKARYWHVPVGDYELIRIPRAFEIGYVFGAIPELIIGAADPSRGGSYREMLGRVFSEGVPQLASEARETFLPPVLPVPVKIVLEQSLNKSLYWSTPLVSRGLERMPPEEQFNEFTPRVAVAAGRVLGVSPKRIEHVVAGLFGGVGRDAMAAFGQSKKYERMEGLSNVNVLGRLFRRGGQFGFSMVSVDKLYDLREAAERRQASREHEETSDERRERLMLSDATKALTAMSFIRARTEKLSDRRKLSLEMLELARDALKEIQSGRPSRGAFQGERRRREREKEKLR